MIIYGIFSLNNEKCNPKEKVLRKKSLSNMTHSSEKKKHSIRWFLISRTFTTYTMHDLFIPFFIDNLLKSFTIVLVIQWHIIIYILFYKKKSDHLIPSLYFPDDLQFENFRTSQTMAQNGKSILHSNKKHLATN